MSRSTEAKSAIEAAAITSWPKRVEISPESWSTGTITPSEVDARMIAISKGASAIPASFSTRPATTASPSETANPSEAARRSLPRSAARSISRPARKSRKASPTRARTSTGSSISTQPSTAGPITIPITISSTTDGSRRLGTNPSSSGAANPAATTISRFSNEISIPASGYRPRASRYRGRTGGAGDGRPAELTASAQPAQLVRPRSSAWALTSANGPSLSLAASSDGSASTSSSALSASSRNVLTSSAISSGAGRARIPSI